VLPCRAITDYGLRVIGRTFPLLQALVVASSQHITNEGFIALAQLKNLTILDVTDNASIDDEGIVKFAAESKSTQLKELSLGYSSKITDRSIEALSKSCFASSLERLVLDSCLQLTGKMMSFIASGMKNLMLLDCSCNENIDDEAIAILVSSCSSLKALDLTECDSISDKALEAIGTHLFGLRDLRAACCTKFTDAGIHHLRRLSCLRTLKLSRCEGITADGIEMICKSFGSLVSLLMHKINLNDQRCVDAIAKYQSRLSFCELSGCDVTDEGKQKLKLALKNVLMFDV
jgi:hypothetical protein